MQFLEDELRQVTEMVWESVLGVTLLRQDRIPEPPSRLLAGCVHVTGAWEGAVLIECSERTASQAAGAMFGAPSASLAADDVQDALGELANMTGGNVKALLPGPSTLSLPTVVVGTEYTTRIPGSSLLSAVAFDWDGDPLVVRLMHRTPERDHA